MLSALVLLSLQSSAHSLSLKYQVSTDSAWGCPTVLGQIAVALGRISRETGSQLFNSWALDLRQSDVSFEQLSEYALCRAFGAPDLDTLVTIEHPPDNAAATGCSSNNGSKLLHSPLLRRVEDMLISNGYYNPELSFHKQLSGEEFNLINWKNTCTLEQDSWVSEYTFDGDSIAQVCVKEPGSKNLCACITSEDAVAAKYFTRLNELRNDRRLISVHGGKTHTKRVRLLHSALNNLSGISDFVQFVQQAENDSVDALIRVQAANKPCAGIPVGSWAASMTLKNSEYKTINEAQSAGDDAASGMQADDKEQESDDSDDETVDDKPATLSLSEIVGSKRLIRNMGARTLHFIWSEMANLKKGNATMSSCVDRDLASVDIDSLDAIKLDCLTEIVTNVPSFIEPMYALDVAPATKSGIKKSLASLHKEIHSRWNALFLNSRSLGSGPSSASMSPSMNLGYIFDILVKSLRPLALNHELLLRAGVSAREVKYLLQGKRLPGTHHDLFLMASDIYNQSVDARIPSSSIFQFEKRRWDYRPYNESVLLLSAEEFDGSSKKSRVASSNFMLDIRTILTSQKGDSDFYFSFALHDVHVVIDPGEVEDLAFLSELLQYRDLHNGAEVYVVPVTTADNLNGLKMAKLFSTLHEKPKAKCGVSDTEDLKAILASVEDSGSFSKPLLTRLKCLEVSDVDRQRFSSSPRVFGLSPPSVFVNGQGIRFRRGKVPLNSSVSSREDTLIQALVRDLKRTDFRILMYTIISLTNPMISFGTAPLGSQLFHNIKRVSDLNRIFTSEARSRVLPAMTSILQQAAREAKSGLHLESLYPSIRDFYLVSSSLVTDPNSPLSAITTIEAADSLASEDIRKVLKIDSHVDLTPPPSPLPEMLRETVNIAGKSLFDRFRVPLVVIRRVNDFSPNAWTQARKQLSEALEVTRNVTALGATVKLILATPENFAMSENSATPISVEWREALTKAEKSATDPVRIFIWTPVFLGGYNSLHSGLLDGVSTAQSAFYTVVFHCLSRRGQTNYVPPLCPQLLPQDAEWAAVSPLWWRLVIDALIQEEIELKPAQWNAWNLFDRNSVKSIRLSAGNELSLSPLNLKAIVDPLSKWGQYILPMLAYLYKYAGAQVQILLNPSMKYSELPLNRWTRNVMRPPMSFSGFADLSRLEADFARIQTDETLTGAAETPAHWVLTAREARVDLDNIRSRHVDQLRGKSEEALTISHEINGFYLEGMMKSFLEGGTPASAEFAGGNSLVLNEVHIKTDQETKASDTVSIRRPEYYQLKVNRPGRYRIRLINSQNLIQTRAMPSNFETFDMEDVSELYEVHLADSQYQATEYVSVDIDSFTPRTVTLTILGKQLPMEESTGYFANAVKSLWSYVPRPFRDVNRAVSLVSNSSEQGWDDKTVHIFSLASGHLYERLLRIMALSVRKNTNRMLVFWILDNFLSAKFKEKMAQMTSLYRGMQVRYVTYKWPAFLRPQIEKQRQIWAYKILFLDVLFPLQVPKIIYIDADQVVQADVGELWDMDLKNHVYAFTPFCDDRRETARFRFWDSGYWKKHLDGKPYHISALFVVDLIKFREQQVGSDLREIYNRLSADPNSLANLDQDLPNFAQIQIPIFSLPQEWLWCETWCSDDRKKFAKTIDLCNNPLTHESKLHQARRIVEKWSDYDQELQDRLEEGAIALEQSGGALEKRDEL